MSDETKEADSPSHDLDQVALLSLVREGKKAWNQWAESNPGVEVDFSNMDFENDVDFTEFHFPGTANFLKTTFSGNANFRKAAFSGSADFSKATFSGSADFSKATFSIYANFRKTTFSSYSDFRKTTFSGTANFLKTTFSGSADFRKAAFSGSAYFSKATFSGSADFNKATFSGSADFNKATFSSLIDFNKATFLDIAFFYKTTFSDFSNFRETRFSERSSFVSIDVEGKIGFEDTEFHHIPDFHAVKNPERIALDTVEFSIPKPLGCISKFFYWATGLCGSDRSTMIRIRRIRGIANMNHAVDTERDLAILERNAQVGTAWSDLKKLRPFNQWRESLFTAFFSTLLLVPYRWSSDYGRSIKRPFFWLVTTPFIWFCVHFKLYLLCGVPGRYLLSDKEFSAIKSITLFGAFPISATQRPAYTTAVEILSDGSASAGLPFALQISLTFQSLISLTFLFLIGLALRNFFRMK